MKYKFKTTRSNFQNEEDILESRTFLMLFNVGRTTAVSNNTVRNTRSYIL